MKKILTIIFSSILIIGIIVPEQYVNGHSLKDNYVSIRLTNPIKSKNSVKLYSLEGFTLYRKYDKLNEVEYFKDENITISIGNNNEIDIYNMDGEDLFSFNVEEDLIIASANKYDDKIQVEDRNYRGYINFKIKGNELLTINYLELNSYLYGVLPKEMPPSFHIEALKAQAIAARSYTLANMKHKNEGYDLCDTTHCQVYGGLDGESASTNQAVDETSGMIISHNDKIIDALYHSNSGGYTASSEEVWGGSLPYLLSVKDEFSEGSPNSNWSVMMTPNEINGKLKNKGINIGELFDLEILEISPSQRVVQLKVIGSLGEEILTKDKIRQVLGVTEIKSTSFIIKKEGTVENKNSIYAIGGKSKNSQIIDTGKSYIIDSDLNKVSLGGLRKKAVITKDNIIEMNNESTSNVNSFTFQGKGYGHGVGMSQWGAQKMAKTGYSCEDILKHYYSNVDIKNFN